MSPGSQKWPIYKIILASILVGAALLRSLGASWGMPYIFHPDERFMISRGVHFFTLDMNPHLFIYPSFLMYVLFIVDAVSFALGWIGGRFDSIQAFTSLYQSDPAVFYIPNRLVIALFGILSVWATYKLARLRYNHKVALTAALLLAILPVHVLHSHFVTTDVPCVLFVILSLYFTVKVLKSNQAKNYYLAALFAGLAAGIKYNGGAVILCLILAHLLREWESYQGSLWHRLRYVFLSIFTPKLILACLFSLAIFIASSPFVLLDFNSFLKEFLFQVSVQRRGHGLIFVGIHNKLFYEVFVVFRNWGGALLLASIIISVIRALFKLDHFKLLLLFWSGLYFIALLTSNDFFIRYTLLIIPPLLILTADLLVWAFSQPRKIKWLNRSLILAMFVFMSYYSIVIVIKLIDEDPRITAKRWIEAHVPVHERIGIMTSSTGMQNHDDPPIDESCYQVLTDKSLIQLLQKNPEWLVISRYDYVDFLRLAERYDYTRTTYLALKELRSGQSNYLLRKTFDNRPELCGIDLLGRFPIHDMMYTFPRIEIYQFQP